MAVRGIERQYAAGASLELGRVCPWGCTRGPLALDSHEVTLVCDSSNYYLLVTRIITQWGTTLVTHHHHRRIRLVRSFKV